MQRSSGMALEGGDEWGDVSAGADGAGGCQGLPRHVRESPRAAVDAFVVLRPSGCVRPLPGRAVVAPRLGREPQRRREVVQLGRTEVTVVEVETRFAS